MGSGMAHELVQPSWCSNKDEVFTCVVDSMELNACNRHVSRTFSDVENLKVDKVLVNGNRC